MFGISDDNLKIYADFDEGTVVDRKWKRDSSILLIMMLLPIPFFGEFKPYKILIDVVIFGLFRLSAKVLEKKSEQDIYQKSIWLGVAGVFWSLTLYTDVILGTIYSEIIDISPILIIVGLLGIYLVVSYLNWQILKNLLRKHIDMYQKKQGKQFLPTVITACAFMGWALARGCLKGMDNDTAILIVLVIFGTVALLFSIGIFVLFKAFLILKFIN